MPEIKTAFRYRLHVLLGVMFALAGLVLFQPDTVANGGIVQETRGAQAPSQSTGTPLPETLRRVPLSAALDDPFISFASVPVAVVKTIEIPPPPPPPPPVVSVPPLNLLFIGRVTQPSGKELVYLAHGDNTLLVTEGQRLPNGYKVDAVTQTSVRFSHPQLENPVLMELPAPPTIQIR